ncbi:hypothetical protein TDIS_1370 [Thermosulfurimonas dismutans]|uniref:Uncharacterized protein n=1 Tax=Thermosulfurimonas dismutans TaxID=999894 RepID=A0A179D465_9BACT|nr:hypothetical protein TDIS_1370 [Thermosulfurimonas dismutans]
MLKGKMATFCVTACAEGGTKNKTQNVIKDRRILILSFSRRKFKLE